MITNAEGRKDFTCSYCGHRFIYISKFNVYMLLNLFLLSFPKLLNFKLYTLNKKN